MIRHLFREIGRAPVRIVTSVLALALAIGAIGVLAVPAVSTHSLRSAAEEDGIPHLIVRVDDTRTFDVERLVDDVGNVDRIEAEILTFADLHDGRRIDLLGVDFGNQEIDVVGADVGRLPTLPDEVLVSSGVAEIGDRFDIAGPSASAQVTVTVVGIGGTAFWSEDDLVVMNLSGASDVAGTEGANRLVVRSVDADGDALRATSKELRTTLAEAGVTATDLPMTVPDGRHPIEAEIEQISALVGLLGIVAGLVALVLLASTVNTLITERTREVAIMRALGATNRQMRRRLRRLAIGIAAAAVALGVPLGIVVSNAVARLVLEEFLGLTPGFAVSIPVIVGSAVFGLVGARLVAARAARRVTARPLAEALRDRNGSPFGRRLGERLISRLRVGALLDRTAVRNGIHQRARSLAIVAQITAAVAALLVITSLATTITDYNAALVEPVQWESRSEVPGPGLDIPMSVGDGDQRLEVATEVEGELAGWDIDVTGFAVDTAMIDRTVDSGRWFADPGDAVVSTGFAERVGIELGDEIDIDLASGIHTYDVVGLHPDRDRAVFVADHELAADLGQPGTGNVVLSLDEDPPEALSSIGAVVVERRSDLDDDSGTTAILLLFSAIGAVVVSVAGLAVASGLAVGVYERRHQFAAMRAIGGRRRHVFRAVVAELLPLALVGIGAGVVAGWFGAGAIMESFEASNAIEIGFTFAVGAIPAAAAAVLAGVVVLGGLLVRRIARQPIAVSLRGAA